jgi:hypothetical protein
VHVSDRVALIPGVSGDRINTDRPRSPGGLTRDVNQPRVCLRLDMSADQLQGRGARRAQSIAFPRSQFCHCVLSAQDQLAHWDSSRSDRARCNRVPRAFGRCHCRERRDSRLRRAVVRLTEVAQLTGQCSRYALRGLAAPFLSSERQPRELEYPNPVADTPCSRSQALELHYSYRAPDLSCVALG